MQKEDEDNNNKHAPRYTKFRTYKSKDILDSLLSTQPYGAAISVIILKNNSICVSCKEKSVHVAYWLNCDDEKGSYWNGTWVTTINIGEMIEKTRGSLINENDVLSYGLILPCHSDNDVKLVNDKYITTDNCLKPVYQIITSDWKERIYVRGEIDYILPKVFGCKY